MSSSSSEATLVVRLEGFEGPLDLLLELARAQKVDLARISVLALVSQFLAAVEAAHVRLELAADWLVMAAWLTWLKSRLLVPSGPEAEEAEEAAGQLTERLQALEAIRTAAAWLNSRPILGQDVFARAAPEDHTEIDRSRISLDVSGLIRAYLAAAKRGAANRRYTPRKLTVWTVKEALSRLAAMLGSLPDWTSLERFLPRHLVDPAERRAAIASTLMAGLELARDGALRFRQDHPFGPILLHRRSHD
jgi:segregation and condensation protein A